jgi:CheY-like chemotaxis protein
MPPLRGFGIISMQNYKDVAPAALKPTTGFLVSPLPQACPCDSTRTFLNLLRDPTPGQAFASVILSRLPDYLEQGNAWCQLLSHLMASFMLIRDRSLFAPCRGVFGVECVCTCYQVPMRKKILVVEDDPDQLEVVRFTLKNAGFAVGTATNGIEALKKAQTVSPDLIVLDVMMPELDGFAVCETLRGNPTTASIPVLMLTGLCSHISRLVAYESGATDYVIKPFDADQLVSKVEKLLYQQSEASKTPGKPGARPVAASSK